MYAQVEKPKENKSKAVANSVGQRKSNVTQVFGFVDNRTEAVAQSRLQELVNKSPQAKKATPLQMITNDKWGVVQRRWLHCGGADFYWDKILDGLQWYFYPQSSSFKYKVININHVPGTYRESILEHENQDLSEQNLDEMGFAEIEDDSHVVVDPTAGFVERANAKSARRDPDQAGHLMNYAEVLRTTEVEEGEWVKIDSFETDPLYSGSSADHLHAAGINQIHNSECADPKVQDQVELGIQDLRQDGLQDEIDVFHYDDEEPCEVACATNIQQQAVRLQADIHLYLSEGRNAHGLYEGAVPTRTYGKGAETQILKRRGFATGIEQVSSEIVTQLASSQAQLDKINSSIQQKTKSVPPEHLEKAIGQSRQNKLKLERYIRALRYRLAQLQMMKSDLEALGQM